MHLQRWITALVILPFLIWLIVNGGIAFSLFIGAVAAISLWEYYHIVFHDNPRATGSPVVLLGYFSAALMIGAAHTGDVGLVAAALAVNCIGCGLLTVARFGDDPTVTASVGKQVQGSVYVALFLSFLVLMRQGPDGGAWVFFLLFIVFFGDIGAYYAGRYYGNRKLCPSVSPGKTVEGALGGLLASVGIGIVFKLVFLPDVPLGRSIIMFLCIGIVAPLGDLFESTMKRVGNIKDSGVILPGHGGLLDRIDAVLFAIPVAYLFKTYVL